MRAELLRVIDEAIAKANTDPDYARELALMRFPAKKPTKDEVRAHMVAMRFTNLVKAESDLVYKRQCSAYTRAAEVLERIGYVTLKYPGGTFKVINTVDRLKEFRDKVEKSPGFSDRKTPKPSVGKDRPTVEHGSTGPGAAIKAMIDDGDPQAAVDYAAARGLVIADVLKGDKVRLPKVVGLTPTAEAMGEFEPEVAETEQAASPSASVDAKPTAAPAARPVAEPPAQATAEPMAWHTPLPEHGEPATDQDRTYPSNPKSEIDARKVVGRLAREAMDAITRVQRVNIAASGMKLYPWVLPAQGNRHGVVRLLPEDQVPGGAWQRVGTEPIAVGGARDRAESQIIARLGSAPIVAAAQRVAAAAAAAEALGPP